MESENKFFSISGTKFPYEDKDPIFTLEGPCGQQIKFNEKSDGNCDCAVCKETFKNVADINYWYSSYYITI